MSKQDQTLTLPEVAALAGIQTDTLRMWYRRGYLEQGDVHGWRRYSVKEALIVMFYAQIVRATKDHEIAAKALDAFVPHAVALSDSVGEDRLWLVYYREIFEEFPELREHEIDDEDELRRFLGDILDGVTGRGSGMVPIIIRVSDIYFEIALKASELLAARSGASE